MVDEQRCEASRVFAIGDGSGDVELEAHCGREQGHPGAHATSVHSPDQRPAGVIVRWRPNPTLDE